MNKKQMGRWSLSLLVMLAMTQAIWSAATVEDESDVSALADDSTEQVAPSKKPKVAKKRKAQGRKLPDRLRKKREVKSRDVRKQPQDNVHSKKERRRSEQAKKKVGSQRRVGKKKVVKKKKQTPAKVAVATVDEQDAVLATATSDVTPAATTMAATPVVATATPVVTTTVAPAQPVTTNLKAGMWASVDLGAANQGLKLDRIALGDRDNVWATVAPAKALYQLQSDGGFELQSAGDSLLVSAGSDNTVAVVNALHDVYVLDNGKWDKILGGKKITSLAVIDKDSMWAIEEREGMNYLWRYENAKWEQVKSSDGKDVVGFSQVAANASGTVFLLTPEGELYHMGLAGLSEKDEETVAQAAREDVVKPVTPAAPAASVEEAEEPVVATGTAAAAAVAETKALALVHTQIKDARKQIKALGGTLDQSKELAHQKRGLQESRDIFNTRKEINGLKAKLERQTNKSLRKQTTARIATAKKKLVALQQARSARLASKLKDYQTQLASLQASKAAPAAVAKPATAVAASKVADDQE